MRLIITVAAAVCIVVLATSCSKHHLYKNYNCVCTQEVNGAVMYQEQYGVQAEDQLAAGVDCNDIEYRVNYYNKSSGIDRQVNCKLR